jgi:hypothetical protein
MLDARCGPYLQSLATKERHTSQKKAKAWEGTKKIEKSKLTIRIEAKQDKLEQQRVEHKDIENK